MSLKKDCAVILLVTPENRSRYTNQLEQYFRIRKQIFADQLKWDVIVRDEMEYDRFDSLPAVYILAIDTDGKVAGGLRQMWTDGPTLTRDVFLDMLENPDAIFGKDVWETTRFVIRPQDKDIRFTSGVNRVAVELCAASLETGMRYGIRKHIAVCEERVIRLTRAFAIPCDVLGRKTTREGEDILCVAWDVSAESLARLDWARNQLSAA